MKPLDALDLGFVDKGLLENLGTNLWQKRASVMVGAGFSCNATPNSTQSPSMPIWSELVGDLQRELGNAKESNVLNLADMYEATFGRTQLDIFLATHIPDMSYSPSNLHKDLLNLPWRDVFTTNYDTLLERASAAMLNHYDIVRQKEDIPLTKPPRIVKLHGTFGMARPLVFTGEDYRRYPQQSAAFVNFVQQSMLENVFCLLGFSGDDINFLKWMGWIRDNIGDYHQPIYICGILDVDNAKRNIWHRRGIVPIDLAPAFPKKNWPDAGERYKRALGWLLDNLMAMKPAEPKDWAAPTPTTPPGSMNSHPLVPRLVVHEPNNTNDQSHIYREYDSKKKVRKLCKQIEDLRKSYPGWIVAPKSVRCRISDMWRGTWHHIHFSKVNTPALLIDLAYEYDWAMRVALQNLSRSHNRFLAMIVDKVKDCRTLEAEHKEKWLSLALSLVRYSRVTNDKESFDRYSRLVVDYLPIYTEIRHKYNYEHFMQAVQLDDFQSIENFEKDWFVDEEDSLWNLKKAAILAETGHRESARRYVENFIRTIKNRISADSGDDIYLYSAYGWALYLYGIIGDAEGGMIYDIKEELDKIREHGEDPRQRMQELADIKMIEEDSFGERIENGFDSNRISITTSFTSIEPDSGLAEAASFFEEVPIPVRSGYQIIFPMKAKASLKSRTASSSIYYWPLVGRLKDYDLTSAWMTSMRILKMTDEEVTFNWQRISKILKMLYLHDSVFRIDRHEEMMRINMELTSRLAFRLKDDQLRMLMEMLIDIYEHSDLVKRNRSFMQELDLLFERVLQSFKPAMILEFVEKFAQLGLNSISTIPVVYKEYWPEPMSHMININAKLAKKHVPEEWLPKFAHIIDILLQKLLDEDKDIRRRASIRLLFFYELGAMSKEQRNTYAKNLWNKVDSETRLPSDTGMYPEQLLRMLINIEPDKEGLLEKYVSEHDFGEKSDSFGRISATEHPIAEYVRVCLNSVQPLLSDESTTGKKYLLWDEEKAEIYLTKAINAWKSFRLNFIDRDFSIMWSHHFVNAIIRSYLRGLNRLVLPYADADKNHIASLAKELLDDMASSGVSTISSLPGTLYFYADDVENRAKIIEQEIMDNLGSSDSQIVSCAMEAVLVWFAYQSGDAVKKLNSTMSDGFLERLLERSWYLRAGCFIEVMDGLSAVLRYIPTLDKEINGQVLKEVLQHGRNEAKNLENLEIRLQSEPGCSYRRFVSEMVKVALLIKKKWQGDSDDLNEMLRYWTEDFPEHCPLPEVWRLVHEC